MEKVRQFINLLKHPRANVAFGGLRRLTPVSQVWGFDRGQPIDRYYIENFLGQYQSDIHGTVLEFRDTAYATRFGAQRLLCAESIDNNEQNPTTYQADLRNTAALPKTRFDCIIVTQVLQYIDDTELCIRNLHQMLKKDGVILCTLPACARLDTDEVADYWRFTAHSARHLFEQYFPKEQLVIESFGNVFAAMCSLQGISQEEVTKAELDHFDALYPLIVGVRAVK